MVVHGVDIVLEGVTLCYIVLHDVDLVLKGSTRYYRAFHGVTWCSVEESKYKSVYTVPHCVGWCYTVLT